MPSPIWPHIANTTPDRPPPGGLPAWATALCWLITGLALGPLLTLTILGAL